jgi:hypothetical protein
MTRPENSNRSKRAIAINANADIVTLPLDNHKAQKYKFNFFRLHSLYHYFSRAQSTQIKYSMVMPAKLIPSFAWSSRDGWKAILHESFDNDPLQINTFVHG